jgi:hypothetical protein
MKNFCRSLLKCALNFKCFARAHNLCSMSPRASDIKNNFPSQAKQKANKNRACNKQIIFGNYFACRIVACLIFRGCSLSAGAEINEFGELMIAMLRSANRPWLRGGAFLEKAVHPICIQAVKWQRDGRCI